MIIPFSRGPRTTNRIACIGSFHFLFTPLETLDNAVILRACLHEGGGSQVGEVTCGGLPHLTSKRDHIKMRDCMDRRVTPPTRVTSPTWGPPPSCKQALTCSGLLAKD